MRLSWRWERDGSESWLRWRGRVGVLILVLALALVALVVALPPGQRVAPAQATAGTTGESGSRSAAAEEEIAGEYDILIYGGSFAGVAAAISAASVNPSARILLVNPQTALGSIGTVGGQNYMDVRNWPEDPHAYLWNKGWQRPYVTMGTYDRIFARTDRAYNTDEAAALLEAMVREHSNVTIVHNTDLLAVESVMVSSPESAGNAGGAAGAVAGSAEAGPGVARLTAVTLQKVRKDPATGYVLFDTESKPRTVRAKIFVDASDNGRLTRLSGHFVGTLGRADTDGEQRFMAHTLMFKIRGVNVPRLIQEMNSPTGDWRGLWDRDGTLLFYGGWKTADPRTGAPAVREFNGKTPRFHIKPANVAQNGTGSDEYWVNMLLIYNVDPRMEEKDRGTLRFPKPANDDPVVPPWSLDQAWVEARKVIDTPEFLAALRSFPAFENVELVRDKDGKPAVGEMLYIREALHTSLRPDADVAEWIRPYNYALNQLEVTYAGRGPDDGEDAANFDHRVGLIFYWMDSNGYEKVWRNGQWEPAADPLPYGRGPSNPAYLPYEALVTRNIENLLVPNGSANAGRWAWSMLRVIPNLTVAGDAAGVAAGLALREGWTVSRPPEQAIRRVQEELRRLGARLDK
ncbi:MAG: FAD-dependent oxidoreductase [Limnochordales bacterium]|nr:FAD-dependent oxidoreductase [Limnochordales bacterium]